MGAGITSPGCCGCGSGGGGTGGGVTISGCYCTNLPTTLTMSSSDTTDDAGEYQNATFTWGAPPSTVGTSLGSMGYYSDSTYVSSPDDQQGTFYYKIECYENTFSLYRIFISLTVLPFSIPYKDGPLYSWNIGSGNSCGADSLSLTSGVAYPEVFTGTYPVVTITGP